MKHRLTALLFAVLVIALAGFTGAAFAGGGNGNGNGGGNGNSANAPGHQDQSAPAPAPASAAAHGNSSKQSSTSPTNPATGGDNSHGVKPSNSTKHDTYAKASSDQTKQYGNGKTAGQIATQAGYGDATLHGPGNSQPHKVLCGGHEVDVHALAHKGNKCGSTQAVVTPQASESATCMTVTRTVTERVLVANKSHGQGAEHANAHARKAHYETVTKTESVPTGANCSSSTPTVISTQITASPTITPAAAVAPATVTLAAAPVTAPATATATPAATGAVKGAVVALKPTTKAKPAGGVLGATTRLGRTVGSSRLPFTGLPLWIFALVALGLIAVGLGARRSARRI